MIALRISSAGKIMLMGSDADAIRKAIMYDSVRNGRSQVEILSPEYIKDLPSTIVGNTGRQVYLPESVARFLEDIDANLYSGKNKMLDQFLRGFDTIQQLFKAPLIAPWISTWFRNGIGNVSLVSLKTGAAMFDPEHMVDLMKTFNYFASRRSPSWSKYVGAKGEAF